MHCIAVGVQSVGGGNDAKGKVRTWKSKSKVKTTEALESGSPTPRFYTPSCRRLSCFAKQRYKREQKNCLTAAT